MTKTDITVSRGMAIQPKQFEALKPGVSITLKDIPVSKLSDIQFQLIDVVDGLFKFEIASEYFQYSEIKSKGLEDFYNKVVSDIENIKKDIKESIEEIGGELNA